jgi:hypothetical protein
VGEVTDVDLLGQLPSDRLAEGLRRRQRATGEGPAARGRSAVVPPEQDVERVVTYLQNDGEHLVPGASRRRRHWSAALLVAWDVQFLTDRQ